MPRHWTGDRFLGSLELDEEAPFLDFDGQAAQKLQREVAEASLAALSTKAPHDPTTDFFGRTPEVAHAPGED